MSVKVQIIAAFTLLLIYQLNATDTDAPIVETASGQVKGSLMKTRLGKTIYSFRGIYYAEAPIGEKRFKPRVPIKPWNGSFDATEDGPACIQKIGINMSEDCLTINIYTKQLNNYNQDKKLPVIVFIHPGGFMFNSGQSFLYGPRYLLDYDVVLVTLNYRLASLGFLNVGNEQTLGNMGFKDQVLVLKFIRDHIAAFGGDPNSVTITGESAGSRSIILHMVLPMSKGLFHRAIGMSGSMLTQIHSLNEQIDLAVKQAKFLNCTKESTDEMFKCLRKRPVQGFGETIPLFAEWREQPGIIWYPAIEPEVAGVEAFLTADPEELMKAGKINSVPIIFGTTKDEFGFKTSQPIKDAREGNNEYIRELTENWEKLAPICFQYERSTNCSKYISNEFKKFYFNNEPISLNNVENLHWLYADAAVNFPVHRAATLLAKFSTEPVYFYNFTYPSPYSKYVWSDTKEPKAGVAHGDDIQYVFNIDDDIYFRPSVFPMFNDTDREIITVKRLTSLWAHFASTSEPLPNDPQLFGNLTWEKVTPINKMSLNMGENWFMEMNPRAEVMELWDNLFP